MSSSTPQPIRPLTTFLVQPSRLNAQEPILAGHSNAPRISNKIQIALRLILEENHDSDLHDEVSTLWKHSNQDKARRTIQV